ncbi:MAG: hypothetical protein WCC65_00665 [Pseudonocardiaceae bacterium]
MAGLIELGRRAGASLVTAAPVIAQAWRGGGRQARLARLLPMTEIRTTGLREARAASELLAASGATDVVDTLVVLAAVPGDQIITSGPADLRTLVAHRAIPVTVVHI